MTNLVRAELQRAMSRRLVRVFVLLSVCAAALTGVVAFARTASADNAAITAQVRHYKAAEDTARKKLLGCLNTQEQTGVDQHCVDVRPRAVHDPRFGRERVKGILTGTSGIAALIAWVLGASLIGAEMQSRSITTTLTFAPSRWRVFAAKMVAALVVVAGWAAVTLGLLLVAMLPAAILHGTPYLTPSNLTIAGTIGRGIALASIAGMMGFALAYIGRNTAVALGVAFGYIIVIENILGSSIAGWRRWLLLGNVIVFMAGSGDNVDVAGRSVAGAAIFLVAVAATLLVAGATAFRVRDVA